MKMKAIATVVFLVFISIISLRTNFITVNKLTVGPRKPVGHSLTMSLVVAGLWL
jgi:hypothetical protein